MYLSKLQSNRILIFVFLLIIVGALLHFSNLNWGAPFYFHPDERNIAGSVSQLQFPSQMNPHFFAYGSFPIYIIYFTGVALNFFSQMLAPRSASVGGVPFEMAILLSRFYSSLFATLLIPLLFFIGKKLKNETAGLLAAFLATTSVGLIQFAHFGTFEIWLTFFTVLLFWTCLQKLTKKYISLMGIIFGILVSIKISSLALLPLTFFFIPAKVIGSEGKFAVTVLKIFISILLFSVIASFVFFATNPFVFFDTTAFKGTMQYESSLALGTLPVFYTGEFFNTLPVLFQILHIYPFLLNPLITILFVFAFFSLLFQTIKTRQSSYAILITFYLILFASQAFLFVKWTRYMVPTLPFIYLIIAISFSNLSFRATDKESRNLIPQKFLSNVRSLHSLRSVGMTTTLLSFCIVINIIFSSSYFITAFVKQDARVQAYHFAQKTIPVDAPILSEVYDMGIVPFNNSFGNISLFHFYDLDNHSQTATTTALQKALSENKYIILPSQRILKTRLFQKEKFPLANTFYTKLQNGDLGYKKIYETPCDIFCKITYLGSPVFSFEETANVFDRPTVMIFKKI